jgi:hypothetical protein
MIMLHFMAHHHITSKLNETYLYRGHNCCFVAVPRMFEGLDDDVVRAFMFITRDSSLKRLATILSIGMRLLPKTRIYRNASRSLLGSLRSLVLFLGEI